MKTIINGQEIMLQDFSDNADTVEVKQFKIYGLRYPDGTIRWNSMTTGARLQDAARSAETRGRIVKDLEHQIKDKHGDVEHHLANTTIVSREVMVVTQKLNEVMTIDYDLAGVEE